MERMKGIFRIQILFFTSIIPLFINQGYACTRIFHVDNQTTMVARNMDWVEHIPTQFRIYPRGLEHSGKVIDGQPLKWTSKYGSMVVASYEDAIVSEGINEAGLSVHLLSLSESDYGQRQNNIPGISLSMWAQYYLDQFGSVTEAVKAASHPEYQLEILYLPKLDKHVKLHMALEDTQGNSAVIEYLQGKPVIHTSHGNAVLTNDPTYDFQLKNLQRYKGFGGNKPLPGRSNAKDRFVRASWYNKHLPQANSTEEAVLSLFSAIRNVAKPYGNGTERTRWHIIADLAHRVYYYASTSSLNIVNISLDQFDLTENAAIMMLDIERHPELSGDISNQFEPLSNNSNSSTGIQITEFKKRIPYVIY